MKYKKLPTDFFKENRKKLIEQVETGSLSILSAAHQMPRNGDQFFPYRQNSDFFYLTGIEQEKSFLLIFKSKKIKQETLFILKPDNKLETWEGHKLTMEEARAISGIKMVKYLDELEMTLHSLMCEISTVYINLPEWPKFKPDVKSRDQEFLDSLKFKYPIHKYLRLAPILHNLRLIKSPVEIEVIKKACSITRDAFNRVLKTVKPGKFEFEIEAEITYEFLKQGAGAHAYSPIVASGKNACILHYIENDQPCNNGDLLLMDFGAEYANYSADLSRTIPVNGKFSPRQKDMYLATLSVFKYARSLMNPGTTINEYHKLVCERWQEEHIKLGLYSTKDVKNHKGEMPLWFNYYMHGTGHFMGLDVHDTGTRDTLLEPGMIITCEPGLYVIEEGIGIRIENNILITDNGNIDLMEDIPIEIEEIEEIMNG